MAANAANVNANMNANINVNANANANANTNTNVNNPPLPPAPPAVAVQIQDALIRMGFDQDAAVYMTDVQGLDALDEYRSMTDDEALNICRVLRKPGGMTGQPPVQHPGFAVSTRVERNLKLMCYLLRYGERTSRTIAPDRITIDLVRLMKAQREKEENHMDASPPKFSSKDWPRMIESIEAWLRGCLGVTKIPLAYVIRSDVNVRNELLDPPTNYILCKKELIARAPIIDANNFYNSTYVSDSELVWQKLAGFL